MDENIKAYLYDVLNSIHEIESYFPPNSKLFEVYRNDLKTKRAVERDLEIIGEAINRIFKVDKNFVLTNAKKIVATRNIIIHAYDIVSDEVIWGILINHLPKLKEEVQEYLNE